MSPCLPTLLFNYACTKGLLISLKQHGKAIVYLAWEETGEIWYQILHVHTAHGFGVDVRWLSLRGTLGSIVSCLCDTSNILDSICCFCQRDAYTL